MGREEETLNGVISARQLMCKLQRMAALASWRPALILALGKSQLWPGMLLLQQPLLLWIDRALRMCV